MPDAGDGALVGSAMPDEGNGAVVERREEQRGTSWPAQIRLEDGTELPCLIKDVSRSGAKIALPAAFPLARTFLLRIDERGVFLKVRLAWRRGSFCGMRIERVSRLLGHNGDAPSEGPPDADAAP